MEKNDICSLITEVQDMKTELGLLRELILNKEPRARDPPSELMDTNGVIEYIKASCIPMSKSKLYKLTSTHKIPFEYAGTKLRFNRTMIDAWCSEQIRTPKQPNNRAIVKSAQNKLKLK